MGDARDADQRRSAERGWLEQVRRYDPALFAELAARHTLPELSGFRAESASARVSVSLETLVSEGRPAFLIQNGSITIQPALEGVARVLGERLRAAEPRLAPLFPLVGRIERDGGVGEPAQPLGTGWRIARGVIVTNRHVALQFARDADQPLFFATSIDFRREQDGTDRAPASIRRVIWIQRDPTGDDIALLEIDQGTDQWEDHGPPAVPLASRDARAGLDVAVIGYPARAPPEIIPDQDWMRRVYGDAYEVKRIAPGLAGAPAGRASTHDCTTLGGNSGSLVIDLGDGGGRWPPLCGALPCRELRGARQRPAAHHAGTAVAGWGEAGRRSCPPSARYAGSNAASPSAAQRSSAAARDNAAPPDASPS